MGMEAATLASLKEVATVFSAFTGGAAAVKTLMSDGPAQPQTATAPTVEKPTEMPTPNDAAVAAARRKSIAGLVARQGRASTILTDQSSNGIALGA